VFPDFVVFPNHFDIYRDSLAREGLEVVRSDEFRRKVRFGELGHLVYQLAAAPWSLPGFSVRSHLQGLADLDRRAREEGGIVLTAGFYLIEARSV
jgi:hypothetical protein